MAPDDARPVLASRYVVLQAQIRREAHLFWITLAGILLLAALLPLVASVFQLQLLTSGLILAITAMSFSLLAGFGGMVSLAQTAFYGMAAYALAITTKTYGWPPALSVPFAIACAVALSAVFGMIAVRSAGVYFLIMTLALSQAFFGVAMQWQTMTGGYNGISGLARPSWGGISLLDPRAMYYTALAGTALCYVLLRGLMQSPFGLILKGIRDNPVRMAALGIRVQLHRWAMILVSGAVAGLAGVLGTYDYGLVSPDVVGLTASVLVVLAALLGGISHLLGSVIGAIILTGLLSVVSYVMQQTLHTSRYWTVIGAVFILVVIFRPEGLLARARPRGNT